MEDGVRLLESIALHNKQLHHVDGHLQRLAESWAALECTGTLDLDAIRADAEAQAKKLDGKELMMVRVMVDPKTGAHEVNHRLLQGWSKPTYELPKGADIASLHGFRRERVCIAKARTYTWTKPMMHKTTDRKAYDAVKQAIPNANSLFDVLITNTYGFVTEGCFANVAAHLRSTNEWVTPPVTDGLLPGVLRRQFIASGHLRERSLTREQFMSPEIDCIVCFNSVRGVVVAEVEDKPVDIPQPSGLASPR
eukprot:TRINITY_DN10775_c0_g1_i4.p1 TRINITY_DN10775_c0_g1~~TRINITY_DN10775_c0_g1_i4.p1  ORF type:complete len:251 (+),score=66.30 TRINITY_DN10775_c0_g1_i4:42-794(+)